MIERKDNPGSFRDPSGIVFEHGGIIYREVRTCYQPEYDALQDTGLYQELVSRKLLVSHEEVTLSEGGVSGVYKVIKPEQIPFISYPYEWSFSQLKAAALTTMEVQKIALSHGMTLKDASAYNIQFKDGRPVFIDTLSFERYVEGAPWVAYKQFCEHFLAPLALMAYADHRLHRLLQVYVDGIPLDLASKLLPLRTWLRPGLLMHVHFHGKAHGRHRAKGRPEKGRSRRMSLRALHSLLSNIESTAKRLSWAPKGTEWADYYAGDSYEMDALQSKEALVNEFIDTAKPGFVWDLGANTGLYSRIAASKGIPTISFDIDMAAVERNYLDCVEKGEDRILPLVNDLTNPSPALGWAHAERMSLADRGPVDLVLALAITHHLAIQHNVPLTKIAEFLSPLGRWLIIEFVPKDDPKVQQMLANRKDIFPEYTETGLENAFGRHYDIVAKKPIHRSLRTLYFMQRK